MKILILASNPRKDLNIDREIRDLKEVIKKSRNRQELEVEDALAVRVGDLQGLLLDHEPQIVHFCGHGTGEQGLVLQDELGQERRVSTEALKNLFGLFENQVECVLLNACYSEEQADKIVEHINYAIGMSQEILDTAAIAFATGFYGALGYGRSIVESYKFGCNQIHLTDSGSGNAARRSVSEAQRKAEVISVVRQTTDQSSLPEYLKPQLKQKSQLTAVVNSVGASSSQQLSSNEQVELQLTIDRTYEQEIKLKQYREQVREYLQDHELEDYEKDLLDILRDDLELSVAETDKILAEEQAPILQARQLYKKRLVVLIKYYPLNQAIQGELKKFQIQTNLTDKEVSAISQPIFELAEREHQAKLRQRYEQEFSRSIASQYPIAAESRNRLRQLQQSLGLSNEEVARIEEPIAAAKKAFVEDLGGGITLEMVAIAGGTFKMGQTEAEKQQLIREVGEETYQKYLARELPQHQVTIQPFFIGKFAVTQAQYQAILGEDPANFKGEKRPVEKVSWHQAVEFCDRLSQKTGKKYRLPSEAEWEYACRAGTTTPFSFGETIATDLANYNGNYTYGSGTKGIYREETKEVDSFPPNGFGLYEMHGNVWEWCADHWHENYQGAPADGSAWIIGGDSDRRLLRGGSWYSNPRNCRSAYRNWNESVNGDNDIGFRLVCSAACALLYQNG